MAGDWALIGRWYIDEPAEQSIWLDLKNVGPNNNSTHMQDYIASFYWAERPPDPFFIS